MSGTEEGKRERGEDRYGEKECILNIKPGAASHHH